MIPFDINKLRIEHVYVKHITTALGGAVTLADPITGKTMRVAVPFPIARTFIKEHKTRNYVVPVLTAIMYYDNMVVALERHHLGHLGKEKDEGLFGERKWESVMERFLTVVTPILSTGTWFVDGNDVYRIQQNRTNNIRLSGDGKFQSVAADCYKFADFQKRASVKLETAKHKVKHCLQYITSCGQVVISAPIWTTTTAMGKGTVVAEDTAQNDSTVVLQGMFPYDSINNSLLVNVNFALSAAKVLSEEFGYESIEPLCLDDLMVHLKTVNLPNLETHIKKTHEISMSYTHAIAWLMGWIARSETLSNVVAIRSLLKYLSSTGCYQRRRLESSAVFQEGYSIDNVPLIDCRNFATKLLENSVELCV